MVSATAPGKIILFGEHAVVYGRPAIAVPLSQLKATAVVSPGTEPGIRLIAPDLGQNIMLTDAPPDDPIAAVIRQVQTAVNRPLPDLTMTVSSQIPVASGLGSGAAITAAVIRALAGFLGVGHLATNAWVSALTYEVEKIHHGTPSGIDNTVVAYEMPVYFIRQTSGNHLEPFTVAQPLHLLVADTGVRSSTRAAVGDVRRQWQAAPEKFEAIFDGCGRIAVAARAAIEAGDTATLGALMAENHAWLQEMTVSSPELDTLVTAAANAGALGAKLSGAGRGGNMIALVTPKTAATVHAALHTAGAKTILATTLEPS